jgi:hypothetical protein
VQLHGVLSAIVAGTLLLVANPAGAQSPPQNASKAAPAPQPTRATRPAWNELTPAQREALAPLAGMWTTLEADQKQKWLEVAERYPNLAADGKQRVHQRMAEYARLTPEQRRTARENFRRAYELPADERQEKLQKYQDLPEDKKRELADRAARQPEAQRRPPSAGKADSKNK